MEVVGDSWGDRLTKWWGGPAVRLEITDWSSTMILAHSKLEHAETFGMLSLVPQSQSHTTVQVTILARRSRSTMAKRFDPVRARVRRRLIRQFLRSDVNRLTHTRYCPDTLIGIDRQFAEYFQWLASLPR